MADANAVTAAPAVNARTVDPGNGWTWIAGGWELFKKQPGIWIAMLVIAFIIFAVLAFIPILGSIATVVLSPIFGAGIVLGTKAQADGGQLEIGHLFAGFKQDLNNLVVVGVLYLVGWAVIMGVVFMIGGASIFAAAMGGDSAMAAGAGIMGMLLALLVMLALMVPLLMAVWYAAPLVVLGRQGAVQAMQASFFGCLTNIVPVLVYGVIGFVLGIVASIPFGLGWLVLGPVIAASIYVSYKDIYG